MKENKTFMEKSRKLRNKKTLEEKWSLSLFLLEASRICNGRLIFRFYFNELHYRNIFKNSARAKNSALSGDTYSTTTSKNSKPKKIVRIQHTSVFMFSIQLTRHSVNINNQHLFLIFFLKNVTKHHLTLITTWNAHDLFFVSWVIFERKTLSLEILMEILKPIWWTKSEIFRCKTQAVVWKRQFRTLHKKSKL